MGLLSKFMKKQTSSHGISKDLQAYLDKVDAVYLRAYATKTTRELKEYVTNECALKVSRQIFGAASRYFGTPKFRNTDWMILTEEDNVLTLLKEVTYDSVRVSDLLKISAADDYKEHWVIDCSGKVPVVLDIIAV